MKIAIFNAFARGGHAVFTHCLIDGLAHHQGKKNLFWIASEDLAPAHRAAPVTIVDILPALKMRTAYPSKLAWVGSRLSYYYRRERIFLEWVRVHRPDIVHLQEWFPEFGAALVTRLQRLGARVVITVHNLERHEQHYPGQRRWQRFLEHRMWRRADRLVVLADCLRDQLCATSGVDRARVACIPHWVWPGGTSVPPAAAEIKRTQKTALLFGALRSNKGIDVFIRACAGQAELSGLVVGFTEDRQYLAQLNALIRKLDAPVTIENRFIAESDVGALFARASIAVYPYTNFLSQSGALFTAVSHETPVVGTNSGALGETIDLHGLGATVQTGQPQELLAAMRSVLEAKRYETAVAACQRLKQVQTIALTGKLTADLYQNLVSNS